MRSILCILLAVFVALSLTACKKKPADLPANAEPDSAVVSDKEVVAEEDPEPDNSAPSEEEPSTPELPPAPIDGESIPDLPPAPIDGESIPDLPPAPSGDATFKQEAPPATLEENVLSGTIADASTNTIMIKTDEGKMRAFATVDADKSACNGLKVGSRVEIYYTGELNEHNTADVTVTRLVQETTL